MRAMGIPLWMVRIVALQAPSTVGEGHDAAGDRLGDALQPQHQLGDDAERAFRADQQAGEIVAGGRLLRPVAGLDHAPSGITAVRLMTLSRMVP